MNIDDFLNAYQAIFQNESSTAEIDMLYKGVKRLSKGTEAELLFSQSSIPINGKIQVINTLADDFETDSNLLKDLFPHANHDMVKSRLAEIEMIRADSDSLAYNKKHFSNFIAKQAGITSMNDIKDSIQSYHNLYEIQIKEGDSEDILSDGELLTLYRYSKDPKYKALIDQRSVDEPLIIGGYASVEMIDREGHLITTEALEKAFARFMKSFRTRNIAIGHSDVQVGWPLPVYISKDNHVYKSGTDNKGLYVICEIRPDTQIANKVAKSIIDGEFKSYSIAGTATDKEIITKAGRTIMQVNDLELQEISICLPGNEKVWTRKGLQEIKNIIIGEEVLTHRLNWRMVLAVMSREVDESLLKITTEIGFFTVTIEHPVLALDGRKGGVNYKWKKANELQIGDIVPYYQPPRQIREYGHVKYAEILSIERIPFAGTVYNLKVAEDDSYVVESAMVHNCEKPVNQESNFKMLKSGDASCTKCIDIDSCDRIATGVCKTKKLSILSSKGSNIPLLKDDVKKQGERGIKYGDSIHLGGETGSLSDDSSYAHLSDRVLGILLTKGDLANISVKAIIQDKDDKILILKDAYSDYWGLPGGHIKDDENLIDALCREVFEETGLELLEVAEYTVKDMKLGNKDKVVIFFSCTADGKEKLSEEHTDHKWIGSGEIPDYNLGQFSEILEDYQKLHPFSTQIELKNERGDKQKLIEETKKKLGLDIISHNKIPEDRMRIAEAGGRYIRYALDDFTEWLDKELMAQNPLEMEDITDEEFDLEAARLSAIAEYDAISLYEQLLTGIENKGLADVLMQIIEEEEHHVGELEDVLDRLNSGELEKQSILAPSLPPGPPPRPSLEWDSYKHRWVNPRLQSKLAEGERRGYKIGSHWVNVRQTPQQRVAKYRKLREAGVSAGLANRVRDWTDPHVKQLIQAIKEGKMEKSGSVLDLTKWLEKQEKNETDVNAVNIIEVEDNIDYDPENAFWIAESRGKEAKNESVN